MAEALEKIQAILKEAKTLALFSEKNSDDYKLLAKEALRHCLENKKINVIALPDNQEFRKKWGNILPNQGENIFFSQQTSIRIPKSQYKIKELTYEDDDDFLSLIITSENSKLDKSAVSFEPVPAKADAAFCFFEPSEEEALQEFENQLSLPPKEKIVFLTTGTSRTFSEKISQIIKRAAPEFFSSPQVSTLLFASLITETNNFVRPISQEALRFGSDLLSFGADKEKIKNILDQIKTVSFSQLLGRALARTRPDEKLNVSWTFLSQKDLEKTENKNPSASFFYDLIQKLREIIPLRQVSLIFWPASPASPSQGGPAGGQNSQAGLDGKNIFAMAVSSEEKNLISLAEKIGVKAQSKYLMAGPFNNFSEAELHFRKILGETDILRI